MISASFNRFSAGLRGDSVSSKVLDPTLLFKLCFNVYSSSSDTDTVGWHGWSHSQLAKPHSSQHTPNALS